MVDMSRQSDMAECEEELRQLRLKHAKAIARSAEVLVQLESANDKDRAILEAQRLARKLPDADKSR